MKTSANITGVFDLDTGRLIGLAPKGTSDVTYVAGQDTATPAGALPVTATTDHVTGMLRNSVGGQIESSHIRAAIAGVRQNVCAADPYNPAPAHATNTTYGLGAAVTNGGNTYLAMVAGTSGASSPPTGTTNNPITDGSVTWLYLGAAPASTAGAPTAAVDSIPGALSVEKVTDALESWYRVRGGSYTLDATGVTWNTSEPANTSGLCIEFMTDAPDIVLIFKYGVSPVRIAVNDRFLTPSTLSSGGTNLFRVQMNGPRRPRKVSVYWGGSHHFSGVRLSPQDSVWRTQYISPFSFFMVGDSFTGGSNYHSVTSDRAIHHEISAALGASQFQSDGIGGSGYIAPGSGVAFGHATRLSRIPSGRDVIVVAGGINDTSVGLQDAVSAYLRSLRATQPSALIYVLGSWAGSTGPDATTLSKESQISAAVSAIADPRIVFIPVSSDVSPFVSGTGKVSATNGTGNSDVYTSPDGTHPVTQAIPYFARRIADAIIKDVFARY